MVILETSRNRFENLKQEHCNPSDHQRPSSCHKMSKTTLFGEDPPFPSLEIIKTLSKHQSLNIIKYIFPVLRLKPFKKFIIYIIVDG